MKKQSRKLVATYKSSTGETSHFTYKNPTTDKSAEEIKDTLELLTLLDIFNQDGVNPFEEVITAKYVETIETTLFDPKEDVLPETSCPETYSEESDLEVHQTEIPTIPDRTSSIMTAFLRPFKGFTEPSKSFEQSQHTGNIINPAKKTIQSSLFGRGLKKKYQEKIP